MEVINSSVKQFLATQPSEEKLFDFIRSYFPKELHPTHYLHTTDIITMKTPVCLYATLMVQDIRESQFYYPLIVKKPINKDSQFQLFKYGNSSEVDIYSLMENDQYTKVLMDRQTLICSSVKYQTEWIRKLKGEDQLYDRIEMVMDGRSEYKLGQVFHCVCIWEPISKKLYYVREVSPSEAIDVKLDLWEEILQKKQLKFPQQKNTMLKLLSKVCSQKYSHFLLYTLISNESMFISGDNIERLASQLLPRVFRLQLKAPFKSSLFPYKIETGQLVETPMQMSEQNTFIIVDFSQLTTSNEVKIENEEIDNIKALKVFVEEKNTIYRWEYGESVVKHNHSGIIVKASSILEPEFLLKGEETDTTINPFKDLTQEEMMNLRIYISKARKAVAGLTEKSRKEIQEDLKSQKSIQKRKLNLHHLLKLSKLNAISEGRQDITYEDYLHACQLMIPSN